MSNRWLQLVLFLLCLSGAHLGLLKFTNIKCQELPTNNGFCRYEYCHLKVVRRNQIDLSMKLNLFQLPITNMTTRLQCFQRSIGYRPFFYNKLFDFCSLMAGGKYPTSFERFIFDTIKPNSNLNHSCPWTEDHMMVEKFALDFKKVHVPLPSGVYRLDFTFYAYGKARSLTQIYFEKLE